MLPNTLLAWCASQFSLFFSSFASLLPPQAALGYVTWSLTLLRDLQETVGSRSYKNKKTKCSLNTLSFLVRVAGLDSRRCGGLVARGHNSPPDCCSVPLVLQVPTDKKIQAALMNSLHFWSEWRDLNPRPLGPEPSAIPNFATPGYFKDYITTLNKNQVFFIIFKKELFFNTVYFASLSILSAQR